MRYGVFFKDGHPATRIREEIGNTTIWEAEVYGTKEEAMVCADRIRSMSMTILVDGKPCGEMKFDVEVREI